MNIVALIQARMTSTRLPGKIMLDLCGKPVLSHIIERVGRIKGITRICVASPEGAVHDSVGDLIRQHENIAFVRGSETDVLSRFHKAALQLQADVVLRITSDCPFFDAQSATGILNLFLASDVDYASNDFESGYPLGFEVEVMRFSALDRAHREAKDPYAREHVTPYIWQNPNLFTSLFVDYRPNLRHWRLVLDEPADYEFTKAVYEKLYVSKPQFGFAELKELFTREPDLLKINSQVKQKNYHCVSQASESVA